MKKKMIPTTSSLPLREKVRERGIHTKAIFLCGGSGKRMFPITEDKILLDFLGKPLLQHQIGMAREAGLGHFIIVANPGNIEKIEQITEKIPGVKVELALQEKPLGIANALKSAEPLLQGQILVVNPNDVSSSLAYTKIMAESSKSADVSYMLGYQVKEYFPGGYLEVDSQGNVRHIVEKPNPGEEPSNLVNILVHLHNNPKKVLDHIENVETTRDDVYECALDNMVKDGHIIKVIPYTDFWATIKYPWHIFKVMEHFLDIAKPYISPTAHISKKATIEGKVILGDNVKVLENAVVRGPVGKAVAPWKAGAVKVLVDVHQHVNPERVQLPDAFNGLPEIGRVVLARFRLDRVPENQVADRVESPFPELFKVGPRLPGRVVRGILGAVGDVQPVVNHDSSLFVGQKDPFEVRRLCAVR